MRAAVCQMNAGGADVDAERRDRRPAAGGGGRGRRRPGRAAGALAVLRVASPDARARRLRPRRADRRRSPTSRGRRRCGSSAARCRRWTRTDGCSTRPACSTATASSSRATGRSTCSTSTCRVSRRCGNPRRSPRGASSSRTRPTSAASACRSATTCASPSCTAVSWRSAPRSCWCRRRSRAATGEAHWEVLLRARAIEDQCFVVAPAQWGAWGPPEDGRRTHGHSMIVDPWGAVLAEAPGDGDGVWFADLDPAELRRVRTVLPALAHRRLGSIC